MKKVVITGLGSITPIGNDIKTYWENLQAGKCGIDFITKYDTENFKVKIGAEVKGFDPSLYMDKGEIRRTDLYAQYALAASIQAMEDSGLKDFDPTRMGVYVGSGIGGMTTFYNDSVGLHTGGAGKVSPYFVAMMISNIAAGIIAIRHKAQGPVMSIVTACATSTHSIGDAFRTIKYGNADIMLAGGSETGIHPIVNAGFTNCMALSQNNVPNDTSVPFDKRRNGFVAGEGGGVIVLEELEHAKKRGAKIYAEIAGYGNTCDAYHITAPSADGSGAARAIKDALKEAKLKGDSLYINAHGTSTPLNDKSETAAIKLALGEKNAQKAVISSTKSMIGHTLGAAGVLEAIAAIMALKDGVIPPTIGYKEPDPDCDLDYVPNAARKLQVEGAISTSMGFGGHNGCIAFKRYVEK